MFFILVGVQTTDEQHQLMYHHLYMEQNGAVLYQFANENLGNEVPTCLYRIDSGVALTKLMFKY